MGKSKTDSDGWAAAGARNIANLKKWTAAWVATTALAAFGPKMIWDFETLPTIIGVLINLGVGFGMILSNKRHLQWLDELQRKIFLEAAALSLGVGLVCGLSYELLEDIKLISFEPEISHLVILMGLTFLAGTVIGHRKYR